MKTEANPRMQSLLEACGYSFYKPTEKLPESLEKILSSGFRIEQDCILLKDFDYFGPGDLKTDFQKTEFEEFLNDIRNNDCPEILEKGLDTLRVVIDFSRIIHEKLNSTFDMDFRVVLSFCTEGSLNSNGDFMVKFYTKRPSIDEEFKRQNLECYDSEAILVIE